jgi:uncharacterized protein YdbL (DUF1318 family)
MNTVLRLAQWPSLLLCAALLIMSGTAAGQVNLKIDTPAIAALRASLRESHKQLRPHYESGAVGMGRDGTVALRDANLVPLAQRQQVNTLLAQANRDRLDLYREIAVANGHPEWEKDIRSTFAQRWIERVPAGWYYQNASGQWVQKSAPQ